MPKKSSFLQHINEFLKNKLGILVSLGDTHVMFRGNGIKYIVIVKEFGIWKAK